MVARFYSQSKRGLICEINMSAQEFLLKMGGIKFRQGTHLPNLIPTTIFLAIWQTGVTTRMHMHTIA